MRRRKRKGSHSPFARQLRLGSTVHPRQAQRPSEQTTEEAFALQNKDWEGRAAQLGTGWGPGALDSYPDSSLTGVEPSLITLQRSPLLSVFSFHSFLSSLSTMAVFRFHWPRNHLFFVHKVAVVLRGMRVFMPTPLEVRVGPALENAIPALQDAGGSA